MMKKITTTFMIALFAMTTKAQVGFETFLFGASNYWKGNLGVPGFTNFTEGGVTFTNRNDTSGFGDYWSGWAYSALQDTVSIVYATNDVACIAGKGHANSNNYGVAYVSPFLPELNKIKLQHGTNPLGFYVTNTTIAYRSMQNGDGFAKKFGGASSNDSDFFRLDITGWNGGIAKTDTVHFYLADFRDANNANDYIIHDWTFVDLSSLGTLDSITYSLASSDTGSSGMNTPAYFCMDDFTYEMLGIHELTEAKDLVLFPNPVNDCFNLTNTTSKKNGIEILSINGNLITSEILLPNETKKFMTTNWANGTYMIRVKDGANIRYKKFVK